MLRRISRRAVNQANINSTELQSLRIPILSNEIQTEIHQMLLDSQKKKDDAAGLICQAEREVLSELDMINWCPSGKTIVIGETKFSIENNWSIRKLSDVLRVDRLDAEYWDTKYREIEDKINIYNSQQFTQLVNPTERTVKIKDSDDYVYVELSDINENTGMIERTNTYKGSELPNRARLQIKEGDILLSSLAGSINKVAIVREQYDNMLASTGFFTLREAEGKPLNKESILILLRILGKQYIVRESQGAILSAIPRKSLDRLFLPLLSGGTQFLVQKSVNEAFKSQEESQRLVNTAIKKLEDAIAQ
jgi:restriction endonuclease S subunit